jgi:hypothetical protein
MVGSHQLVETRSAVVYLLVQPVGFESNDERRSQTNRSFDVVGLAMLLDNEPGSTHDPAFRQRRAAKLVRGCSTSL